MRKATAELILKDPDRFAHHDRVFLNNPVVMQGMGLAPLVVLATTAHNGVMLAAAVTLLLVPSRVLACLLSRLFPLNSENPAPKELQKKLLPRALVYSLSASVVYLAAYPILNAMFGTSLLTLGIYLPLLVVEPLLTYRFGRVQETLHKAVSKGLRITVGYALLLMLLGIASVFVCISLITTAVLQATGHEIYPVYSMLAGGLAKIAVNWFLIAVPELNITGAPVGTLACYLVICTMNHIFLCKTLRERPNVGRALVRPLLSTLIMAVVAWGVYAGLSAAMGGNLSWKRMALAMLVSMACAVVTYLVAVVKTHAITLADLQLIPKGEKLAKVLHIR